MHDQAQPTPPPAPAANPTDVVRRRDPYKLLDRPELAKAPGVHDGKRTEPCLCTRDDSGSAHDSQHPGEQLNDYGDWETCGWCAGDGWRYVDCSRCGVGAEPADGTASAVARVVDGEDLAWALQMAWDDFVSDTFCYPHDFTVSGGRGHARLEARFGASNFVRHAAEWLNARLEGRS